MPSIRLLLVEDSPEDEYILIRRLKEAGYSVGYVCVKTAESFLNELSANNWDLIISDFELPAFNGLQALQLLKDSRKDIPFILVSGSVGEEIAVEAMRAGADDYIMKDRPERLVPALARTLREAANRHERKLAEQKVRENESRLKALFESGMQSVFLLDLDKRIIWANRHAKDWVKRMWGREALQNDSMLGFVPAAYEKDFARYFECCLNGYPSLYEQEFIFDNGHNRWYQLHYYPVFDDGNRITGISFNLLDVSEKKQAEARLEEMRHRLEGIIASAMDAIITTDQQMNIILFNHAAEHIFGYKEAEVVGKGIDAMIPSRFRQGHQQHVKHFAESNLPNQNLNARGTPLYALRADGTEFPIEASVAQVVVDEKKFFTLIARDITERLAAEAQTKALNAELIRQNEQLQQFGFVTSHNIRGPVATILGLVQLLNPADLDEEKRIIFTSLQISALKLDSVIKDLSLIVDYQKNVLLMREEVHLNEVLENVQTDLAETITQTGASIEADFAQGETLLGVKSYLHSILHNLLSNALKYRDPGRPLVIRVLSRRLEGKLLLQVSDNGLGINLSMYQEKVFGLYKRFHAHVEGKGIGLHLVKTQVEAMGGKISVESQVGVGTTFSIQLPLQGR